MKTYNNSMFLGPGTIKFANGTEIPFTSCEGLEMEFSCDIASSMSAEFRGATIIPSREDEGENKMIGEIIHKKENMLVIQVQFPNSNRIYDYYIHESARGFLRIGQKYRIVNDYFYNYKCLEVTIKDIRTTDQIHNASRLIIAFIYNSDFGRDITWIDQIMVGNLTIAQREKNRSVLEEIGIGPGNNTLFMEYFYTTEYEELSYDDWDADDVLENVTTSITDKIGQLTKYIENLSTTVNNKNEINKGDDNMNIFSNFDFGKVTKDNYAMTLKGIAYRSIGDSSTESSHSYAYVQYNPETNDFEDVTPFILDINVKDFLFKMPVATSAIKAGDIILDMQAPVFVKSVKGSEITVVDPITREVRIILATKNVFNFNFVTKIVNLMDNFNLVGSASAENPFGNILPLMMLSENKNMKDMLPLMLLGNGSVDFASNPMMLYFLMKDGKSNDMLPFLLMSNPNLFGAQNTSASGTE